ncbi:DUF937 domain-containing protein [Nocardia paucivorans]|uniref:DUF937 domain-containing protein n=1 Tax=Nocardia paucivorans TaxID=114259 RepID=UPI0002D8F052|nr:DUF937 domain-containing protein [Nocardia paucivorans]
MIRFDFLRPPEPMTSLDDLFAQIPVPQIAGRLGVDPATTATAVRTAVPTLLGGLQSNALRPDGAAALTGALARHGELVDGSGAVDLNRVDVTDGGKILDKVFGPEKPLVITALGETEGTGGRETIAGLMPLLAPIVLAYLAGQVGPDRHAGGVLTRLLRGYHCPGHRSRN